ncbi:MAG TPA: hypothetical protein VIW07_10620 [Candidatus Udaeobacter sp.]
MATQRKNGRHWVAILSVIGAVSFAFLLCDCADTYYAASNWRHSPEAKYNTDYMPDYYPYYPWDGYYGGAYYYGD